MEKISSVLMTEARVFGRLDSIKIDSLADVLNHPIFSGENKLAVIMDLDGVLCHFGKKNSWKEKMLKLRALTEICKKSEMLMFSTARIQFGKKNILNKNSVSDYPFLTADSIENISTLCSKANPDCQVSFDIGLKKNFGGNNKVIEFGNEGVSKGLNLVVIGSSIFDKKMTDKIVRNADGSPNVVFFDTGCVWF